MQQFPDLVDQIIGHYRILRPLAAGGMATVYQAEDIHLRRQVAIKVFRPEPGETSSFLRRFAREAQVLASLDHPNILLVHDYGEQDRLAYLVMPLMTQGSLKQRLLGQPLPIADVLRLAEQILGALQYAHDHGLVHRDIKPSNLLFKADDTLLLSDFGLVKILPPALMEHDYVTDLPTLAARATALDASTLAYAGTPQYMAPEQINGQAIPQSDLYSVGVVLYELLTGTCPFVGETIRAVMVQHLTKMPRPPRELNPLVPSLLEAAVLNALEKDPTHRYQSASTFLQVLHANKELVLNNTYNTLYVPEQGSQTPLTIALQTEGDLFKTLPMLEPQRAMKHQAHNISPGMAAAGQRLRHIPYTVLLPALLILAILISSIETLAYNNSRSPIAPTVTASPHASHGTPIATTALTSAANVFVPAPQTGCPKKGQANPAVMPTLSSQGTDQNLVYLMSTTTYSPTYSSVNSFNRYDVTTGRSTEIVKLSANTIISTAQVSGDGQWISFLANESNAKDRVITKLEMVRIDGKYLQTLYCTSEIISGILWTPGQEDVVFNVLSPTGIISQNTPLTMYDLFVTTGELHPLLHTTVGAGYTPLIWFHQSNLFYMTNYNYLQTAGGPSVSLPENLYLFDAFPGEQQPPQPYTPLLISRTNGCQDYTLSPDNRHLFISQCKPVFQTELEGPSHIQVRDVSDPQHPSPARTIFSSDTLAILNIAAISNTTLLLGVYNSGGDTSQNGIWRINMDGTGLKKLASGGWLASDIPASPGAHQDVWANISRDGRFYSVQGWSGSKLVYGSLNGDGAPTVIASDGIPIGWTIM